MIIVIIIISSINTFCRPFQVWPNPEQIGNVNSSPIPNHTPSMLVDQNRFVVSNQVVNNISNENISIQSQNNQFPKIELGNMNNSNEIQIQGRNQIGSQILTINGNPDQQNKFVQQQIVFSGQPSNSIRRIPTNLNNELNHIIGPNAQIVSIQTSSNICRSQSLENITGNNERTIVKNDGMNIAVTKIENFSNTKTDCKIINNENVKNVTQFSPPNIQFIPNGMIIPASQSSSNNPQLQLSQCNVNMTNNPNIQQLTPEVIQKINQQQQIFIQQNQKQMELAMKGIKSQAATGSHQTNMGSKSSFSFNDSNSGIQTPSQGALIVTNNSVMVANQQRMPPWQINRMAKMQICSNFVQESHLSNNPRDQINIDEKSGQNMQSLPENNSNLENQDTSAIQNMDNQNMFSRVPPLHHHTPQSVWSDEIQPKKNKSGKSLKKARSYIVDNQRSHRTVQGVSNQHFINNEERKSSPDTRVNQHLQINDNFSSNSSPSFMDDPSGYLAQQTALLNNTIQRQVGFNSTMNSNIGNNSHLKTNSPNLSTNASIPQKSYNSSTSNIEDSEKINFDRYMNSKKCDKNISNNIPSQSNIPDSSMNSDKNFNMQQKIHCHLCLEKSQNDNSCNQGNVCDHQMQNTNFQLKMQNYIQSISSNKSIMHSQPGTPSPNQSLEESPVTSSTFMERPGSRSNLCSDLRGPIQGGIISTSNGSPMESFTLPELSPTPSNSSRNTDTPLSKNSGSIHISSSCPYTIPSPAYSNPGSSRESNSSNPPTPSPGQNMQSYAIYSSPGPINQSNSNSINSQGHSSEMINQFNPRNNPESSRSIVLNQNVPNIISNEQISMNPDNNTININQRRIPQCNVSGYFVPTHMSTGTANINQEGQMMFINSNGLVTTMASGHTLSRNTITSVLAGKAQTATTSINASSAALPFTYPAMTNTDNVTNISQPSINKNVQFEHINVPPDYPMHVAGNLTQNIISKSPLEMVQSVVSSIQVSQNPNCNSIPVISPQASIQGKNIINTSNNSVQPSHILMPSNGQFLVTNGNQTIMAPPPPKNQSVPSLPSSPLVTTVTASMSQTIPAVGGVQQVLNQPTVLVNTLPAPFMLQSQVMAVDGQVVNQNMQMPQIVTGNLISQGRIINDNMNNQEADRNTNLMSRSNLLSPDSGKRKGKKRKAPNQPVTSMLHITAQHSPGSVLVQHNSQQQSQFSPQGFQVSPNSNISTTPMLQALTIVPGKPGTPAHIVMNGGQGTNNNFGSQQIITNSQGPQHINLLQPVNLLNNTGVVQNFPAFQQFIVPGIGSVVMTADGTAILQDTSSLPVQLQIQNVNGQNVLTPVQNQGILTAGTTGMVIRTQTPNNKIIQSQHSPGAQFLSPTGNQIVMSGSPFNGQLSPMVANVSPNQSVTFNTNQQQVRPNIQQEFIQCNQMGQALMLPLSPNQIAISSSSNQQNTTFVQQNTTIVQQQTTMVSNNQNNGQFQNNNSNNPIVPSLNIDQGVLINQNGKPNNIIKGRHNVVQIQNNSGNQMHPQQITIHNQNNESQGIKRIAVQYPILNQIPQANNSMKNEPQVQQIYSNMNQNNMLQQFHNILHPNVRHSVSTQTLVNQQNNENKSPITMYQQISGSSPPDTTTHSPLGALENSTGSPTNSISGRSSNSSQGNQVDTTTGSPEPNEHGSLV